MLAQIEKGEVNPTISILWKIANGYKLSFTGLLDSGAGSLLIRAGEERFLLAEGDSLRFSADVPHSYRNTGDSVAFLSMLIYYARK